MSKFSVIIANQVVSKFMENGVSIVSIGCAEKQGINTGNLRVVTTGSRIVDNCRLLPAISDGRINFERVCTVGLTNESGIRYSGMTLDQIRDVNF